MNRRGVSDMSTDERKIPRYRAYTIDGRLCRDCDSSTLEELNRKVKSNTKAYFVRDNVKEKWL